MNQEFNNMTIMAALEVIESCNSHAKLGALEIEWGVQGRCSTASKAAHIADLARIAIEENPDVLTPDGRMKLERAIICKALTVPMARREGASWNKLIAGLRLDGFELVEGQTETIQATFYTSEEERIHLTIKRMLPEDVPGLDFREAESELVALLEKHQLDVPKGHLMQAQGAFSRGDWASANAQLRSFYEGYLNEIASRLGYQGNGSSKDKRDFLENVSPPFLLPNYNEPKYVQAVMSRSHPEGSHPGLSEEDDCTFRMQTTLITARLFLRRFDQRVSG